MTEKSMLEKCEEALIKEMEKEAGAVHVGFNSKRLVRAVLQALREPDEGMRRTGAKHQDRTNPYYGDVADNIFTAMIDSVLSEPNPST